MARYTYQARNDRGKERTGTVAAHSKSEARRKLRARKLTILQLDRVGAKPGQRTPILGQTIYRDAEGQIQISLGSDMPGARSIVVFTKQFATMIGAGIPLIQALSVLGNQQQSIRFRESLASVQRSVENGKRLSEAMAETDSQIFPELYVSLVTAGEESGKLDTILLRLASYIEKAEKIRSQIKSAMIYPALVIVVAVTIVSGLLAFVVPTFAQQFEESGSELPALTRSIIGVSDFFLEHLPKITVLALLLLTVPVLMARTPRGRERLDQALLQIPVTGNLLKKIAVGRFCTTLGSMLSSGVNLLQGLSICARSAGNKKIEAAIIRTRTAVEQGSSLSEALAGETLFPEIVVSMISVGENTGALDDMLEKISQFYEEEVDRAVATVLALIEPAMILIIGAMVGLIVVALYLPIFDLAGSF